MSTTATHEQKTNGWPHNVGIVREIILADDLATILDRRVTAIRIYTQDTPALTLSLTDAINLHERLGAAIEAAESGPLGELVEDDGDS
jgi:hypothetical protein